MTDEENKRIFDLADHAVDEIDLALGNEFDLDARNRVEKILLETIGQTFREAQIEAYEKAEAAAIYAVVPSHITEYKSGEVFAVGEGRQIAAQAIVALKDSLVPEPVS